MGLFEHVLLGIQATMLGPTVYGVPLNVVMVVFGFVFGVFIGATPGLAGPMAMAIALPILISVFGYEAGALLPILGFLIGVMKGATLGGAVPAILFNTPGTPDALLTTYDGFPMTKKGDAKKALKTAHFSSVTGDTISDIVLIVCAPFLAVFVEAYLDLPEKSALIIFSLTFIAAVMGKNIAKGLIAIGLGLFVAFIGSGEDFYPRLSLGFDAVAGGFPIVTVVLGALIVGEVLAAMIIARGESASAGKLTQIKMNPASNLTWRERLKLLRFIVPSAFIGTVIGALPGIGSTMAATIGYTSGRKRHERSAAPDAEKFGDGIAEGVASTEAANSAVSGANLIPVLSLGIPGNASAIFLILAMETVDGINPGPSVFRVPAEGVNPEMVMAFGVFSLMIMANILNWIFGGRIMQLMSVMALVPKQILLPAVLLVTLTSVYAQETSFYAILCIIGFGFLGLLMRLLGFPILPFVIAVILGSILERTARQAFASTGADPYFLFSSPVSIALMGATFLVIYLFARGIKKS